MPLPLPLPNSLSRTAALVALLLVAAPALAQWSDDPAQNLVVADRPDGQAQPKLVPTPDGGFYVSWFGGSGFDVFLQRLDADGQAQWEDGGIRIADRSFSSTEDYGLSVDAEGNALLVFRFYDDEERAQAVASRISPAGELLWGDPGVFASADPSAAASPRIAGTSDGGAVVAWTSYDTGSLVLQKLDAEGALQWGSDGVSLDPPSGTFFIADLHADAEGNVIISGSAQPSFFDRPLWAQKLDADGAPLWGADPVKVFDGSDGALQIGNFPPFVTDGAGGAVFAWYQVGAGPIQARVQHVLADGSLAFPQNGVDVATSGGRQRSGPAAAFDQTTGDIYVAWVEEQPNSPNPTLYGVFAQRIDAAGTRQWGDAGREVSPLGNAQTSQVSTLPVPGGAIFAWASDSYPNPMRIDAARLDADGEFAWAGDIVPLKTAATTNSRMEGALSTLGFAAYVWSDGPSDIASEAVKAQNVSFAGALGPVDASGPQGSVDPEEVTLTLAPGETASASLTLSNLAPEGSAALTYAVTVARPDTVLVDFEDGENPYGFTLGIPAAETIETEGGNPGRWLRNAVLSTFAPRLYIDEPPFTGDYVEQNVSSVSIDAQTVSASLGIEGRPFSLLLIRHNGEPDNPDAHDYVYLPGDLVPQPGAGWHSYTFPVPSDFEGELPEGWGGGSSADPENLPPGVVWQDILREVDAVEIVWGHPAFFYLLQSFDLGVDNVQITYADAAPGPLTVEPAAGSVAAGESEELTLHVDAEGLAEGTYPFAVQIETNDPENSLLTVAVTVVVEGSVSAEDAATPAALALRQNYPNPFTGTSTIEFVLPRSEHVTLAVYDVTGRRIATLVDREMEAGTHRVAWDAAGLASGTYLYRLHAGSTTRTLRALLVSEAGR